MRKTLAVGISALLLAWGAAYFHNQVTLMAPETGVEWVDSARGVVADTVIPRTPAWKGGLRPGDRLRAIDDRSIASAVDAEDAAYAVPRGTPVSYLVERDHEEAEFTVRPNWVGGGTPVYYYLTLVGLTFLGVGVAGLQAIATARRLGAVVSAYDLRPAVKEQVQSLGARFVELAIEAKDAQDARGYATAQDESFYRRQRELLGKVIAEHDVVITTAVIPGKKAPTLVTKEMVMGMAPGSVIVDLAAERGGNCELTHAGEKAVEHGVTIIGWFNLASSVPYHASQMYARNLTSFLTLLVKEGKVQLNLQDDIIRETLVTQGGEIVNARLREFFSLPALVPQEDVKK